jgi:hypothetical protein
VKRKLLVVFLVLVLTTLSMPAQTTQTADPWCQAHMGDRMILGQFPYFSCVERGADCALHPSPCTVSEIGLIMLFGGKYQPTAAPPDRVRPTPAKRRSDFAAVKRSPVD